MQSRFPHPVSYLTADRLDVVLYYKLANATRRVHIFAI